MLCYLTRVLFSRAFVSEHETCRAQPSGVGLSPEGQVRGDWELLAVVPVHGVLLDWRRFSAAIVRQGVVIRPQRDCTDWRWRRVALLPRDR